jgi:hypothetical protein
MGMTVRTLTIYTRAMGVNILVSMLEFLVHLTVQLDLDFIGIYIFTRAIESRQLFYTQS